MLHYFNHEGIRRGEEFITRKITLGIVRVKCELNNNKQVVPLKVGNIYTKRDWSDSEDFIRAIWMMMNQDQSYEYLLSSDETHTVKEFIDIACKYTDIPNVRWEIDEHNESNTKLYSADTVIY